MPKKKSAPRSSLATFLAENADPRVLVGQLDDLYTNPDDPYHRAYQEARQHFLREEDANVVAVANLLGHIETLQIFEDVARRAGFVVGFEYASGLFGAKKGRAR